MYLIEDGYPYLDLPLLAEDLEPYPVGIYWDTENYPVIPGLMDVVSGSPYPASIYVIDGETENGYPFLELPSPVKLSMPYPYLIEDEFVDIDVIRKKVVLVEQKKYKIFV